MVDSSDDAGCSVTLPPPPRASPDARDRRRGRPHPLGASGVEDFFDCVDGFVGSDLGWRGGGVSRALWREGEEDQ